MYDQLIAFLLTGNWSILRMVYHPIALFVTGESYSIYDHLVAWLPYMGVQHDYDQPPVGCSTIEWNGQFSDCVFASTPYDHKSILTVVN